MVDPPAGPRRRHRVLMVLLVAIGVPLLCCGGLLGYARHKIGWASRTTRELCAGVTVGAPIAGLEDRARQLGLKVISIPERPGEDGELMTWEGFVFSRAFCNVRHRAGRVTGKNVSSLD